MHVTQIALAIIIVAALLYVLYGVIRAAVAGGIRGARTRPAKDYGEAEKARE